MRHELKILPVFYDAVKSGDKTFEIRWNGDRGYQKGDTVIFRAHQGASYDSTRPDDIEVVITYVSTYRQKEGVCVFGFKVMK